MMNIRTITMMLTALLCAALASPARAGLYRRVSASVYETIMTTNGFVHPYGGTVSQYSSHPGADLAYADLEEGNLRGIDFSNADLTYVDFSDAEMWFVDCYLANLQNATLTNTILIAADMTAANLTGASMGGTTLDGVNFYAATLPGLDLSSASLIGTNFEFANIQNADLTGRNLSNGKLGGALLNGAEFSGANLSLVTFATAPNGSAWYSSGTNLGSFDAKGAGWRLRRASYAGDYNGDTYIDAADIDAIAAAIRAGSTDLAFDLDGDGDVDVDDLALLVETRVDTDLGFSSGAAFGDCNLDGVVDGDDLGCMAGGYGVGSGWGAGDVNGDGVIDLLDLSCLGDGDLPAGDGVPEPATMGLLACGALTVLKRRRK